MAGVDKITRDIAQDVKVFLKNPKLKASDILEWCTSEVKPEGDTELTIQLPSQPGYRYAGMWVTVPKVLDKRGTN